MQIETKDNENFAELLGSKEETTPESQPETVEKVEETKEEVPAPSQEEQKPEESVEESKAEEPAVTKEAPFHQHPRWKRMQAELAEAREAARVAQESIQKQQQPKEETAQQAMPQAFSNLFGSSEEAWGEWQKLGLMTKGQVETLVQSALQSKFEEQHAQEQATAKAHEQAITLAEETFADLSDETGLDFSGGSDARNRVLDIAVKYNLLDEQGMPNLRTAFKLYQDMNPAKAEVNDAVKEKREVAAKTNSKTNSGAKESDIYTPAKLKEIEKRGGIHFLMGN